MGTKSGQLKSRSKTEQLREKKIQECRQRICEDRQTIEEIHSNRDRMCVTDVIGIPVRHKLFGTGTITGQNTTSITVRFDSGSKRFVMPSAFLDGFLKTEDAAMNERLSEYICMQQKIREAKDDISASNRTIFALAARRHTR